MKEEDKNIADFFKKRLEADQFEYQEADWNLLEKQLDAAGIGTQGGTSMMSTIKVIIGAIIITSLGFLAGWLIRDQKGNASQANNHISQDVESETPNNNLIGQNQENGIVLNEEEDEACEEESLKAGVLSFQEKATLKENHQTNRSNSSVAASHPSSPSTQTTNASNDLGDTGNQSSNTISKTSAIASSKTSPFVTENSTAVVDLKATSEASHNKQNSNNQDAGVAYTDQYIPEINALAYHSDRVIVPVELAMIEINKVPLIIQDELFLEESTSPDIYSNQNGKFSIGLALSPDFNAAGLGGQMSASLRPGLLIYYQVLPRVIFSTGAHFDQKRYESTVDRYATPSGYWGSRTNGVLPSLINGSCHVIDIPLNVIVKFTDRPRVNFGGSAGVSSYILLDEAYDFEFARDNPGADTGWSTRENSNYIAGLLNFSFYVSMSIGRNTEFLIEPYLKTPIKEIGWVNVALYGTGAQFTLKYNFKSNQKRKK